MLLCRRIVDGEQQELVVASTFAEAMSSFAGFESAPGRMNRVVIPSSNPEIIAEIATAWSLHPLLVEDLLHASQRPKLERYGDVLFVVLKSAYYVDEKEVVEFNEFHLLMRGDTLVIICQGNRLVDGTPIPTTVDDLDATLSEMRHLKPLDKELLAIGPEALVYRLLDAVVDGYFPVLDGLEVDKDEIERQVFSGDAAAAERIYRLSQEVIDVLHATSATHRLTEKLGDGATKYRIPGELQAYLDDVTDHLARVLAEATEMKEALSQILDVNATLVGQRQNDDMKKISGWAAILFAPTLIGAIYGMNFDTMPELHWAFGYPMALGLMLGLGGALYAVFKAKNWM